MTRLSVVARTTLAALVALASVMVASPEATAASPEEEAALLLFKEGRGLFDEGEYQKALDRFEKAIKLVKNDFLVFYMGRTYAKLDRCDEAIDKLGALAGKVPPDADKLRVADLGACQVKRATKALKKGRCMDASKDLGATKPRWVPRGERASLKAMTKKAARCVSLFGTRKKEGQTAARFFHQAEAALEAGDLDKAASKAKASMVAKRTVAAGWFRFKVLHQADKCGPALDQLMEITEELDRSQAKEAKKLSKQCLISETKKLVEADDCRKALPLLKQMEGQVRGADEKWRQEKIEYCIPRATDFITDTPQRKAAYKLYLAAKEARDKKDYARSIELLGKALGFSEEPVLRRTLADVHLFAGSCEKAVDAVGKVPGGERTKSDNAILESCKKYPPPSGVSGEAYGTYVRGIAKALTAKKSGKFSVAAAALSRVAKGTKNRDLWVLYTDTMFEAGKCKEYLAARKGAVQGWAERLTDAGERAEECRVSLGITNEPDKKLPEEPVDDGGGMSQATVGWIVVGVGAALLIAGGAMGGLYAGEATAMEDAAAIHNTTPDDALAAQAAQDFADAESGAQTMSGLAWGLGAAGAAALGVGLFLALTDDGGTPEGKGSTDVGFAASPGFTGMTLQGAF